MEFIFKDICRIFSFLGIYPDFILSKNSNYEEVEIKINNSLFYILRNGFYPELIKRIDRGIESYKKNGKLHRIGKPAVIAYYIKDKFKKHLFYEEFYQNGKLYRIGKPAVIFYYICEIKNYENKIYKGKIASEGFFENNECVNPDIYYQIEFVSVFGEVVLGIQDGPDSEFYFCNGKYFSLKRGREFSFIIEEDRN